MVNNLKSKITCNVTTFINNLKHMKLLSILILFTTAVAAAGEYINNCNAATYIHMTSCSNILLASHFNTALGSSGDEAVLDLEETPTLRGLKSRNCDGVGPNTCDNRSNCIWNDDRSRSKQQRQGRNGRNRSNGWCEDRDSHFRDDDSCRGLRFNKCTNRRNSNYCRWSNSKDRCVDRGKFCSLLFHHILSLCTSNPKCHHID